MPPSSHERSFRQLVDLAIGGDLAARDAIFDRVARADGEGPLLMIARKVLPRGDRVRDIVESHDLVQTALRSGWVHLEQFRGETFEQFLAWLRTILRHKLLRLARGTTRGAPSPVSLGDSLDAGKEAPLEDLTKREARDRVRRAIAGLSEPLRLVLELRLRGMSPGDIATKLDVKPDAVRQRESRAVKLLRERLADDASMG